MRFDVGHGAGSFNFAIAREALEAGAPADISLLGIEEGQFQLMDMQKNAVTADNLIVSRLTIVRGRRLAARL